MSGNQEVPEGGGASLLPLRLMLASSRVLASARGVLVMLGLGPRRVFEAPGLFGDLGLNAHVLYGEEATTADPGA